MFGRRGNPNTAPKTLNSGWPTDDRYRSRQSLDVCLYLGMDFRDRQSHDPYRLLATPNENAATLDFSATFGNMRGPSLDGGTDRLIGAKTPIFWPMLVGSMPSIIIDWLLFISL